MTARLPQPGRRGVIRAAALLSAAALPGCSWLDDLFETTKIPVGGKRESVLPGGTGLQVDKTDHRTIALPAPVQNAAWSQSGSGPTHVMGNLSLGDLKRVWRRSIGEGGGYRRKITATPVVGDGHVFTMDSDASVSAFDAATGNRVWNIDTQAKKDRSTNVGGGLALQNAVLYATTGRGDVLAIDPASGKITWRVSVLSPTRSAPTIADGKLFVPTIDERLLCLALADGQTLWSYQATAAATSFLGEPAPAFSDGLVVAGFGSGDLVALRSDSGTLAWNDSLAATRGRTSLADLSAIRALPVVASGTVYAIGLGGLMVALDLRSGRRLWERDVAGQQTPCMAGDWLFLLTDQQTLACVNAHDGRVRWMSQLPRFRNEKKSTGPLFWVGPLLCDGYLYVAGSHERLVAVDATTGATLGEQRLPDVPAVSLVAAGGRLFVITDDGTISALG